MIPVIYLPIKPIYTKYGFIVIGLSICGLFIFPWSLFVNYSSKNALPFFDPTITLKNEVEDVKKKINNQLSQFRINIIKTVLDKTKEDLNNVEKQISNYKEQLEKNKILKPKKVKNLNYLNEYKNWNQKNLELRELISTESIKKWKLEKKYFILDEAYKNKTSVKDVDIGLKNEEKLINSQIDKLNILVDNIDNIISPLPITLKPETANFGITIKNPKPLIKIKDELDDNINEKALNKITENFRLKNSDFMLNNYSDKISNFNSYKKNLITSMPLIVKQDPFPRYSQLSIKNIRWLEFLYKDFISTGAQTFGFPGFPPFSI